MRATKTTAYYISPIEIGVLWAKITYVKSHLKALGFLSPNIYEIDLSNEVLNIDFDPGAAKILKVKVGGRKKYLPSQPCTEAQTPKKKSKVKIF